MDNAHRVDLRIVPAEQVRPHEIADPGREHRIEERLRQDRQLRDPLMVGAVPDFDGLVLLDGTNRKRALATLGLPNVLVQVIDYGDEHAVELRTWCHSTALPLELLVERAGEIPGVVASELPELAAGDALRSSTTLAVILDENSQFELRRLRDPAVSRADQLRQLVDIYEEGLVRVDCSADEVEERAQSLMSSTAGARSLIAFPAFSRSQVVTMAKRPALIPAGITRHIIRAGRALRVNVPIEMLDMPDADAVLRRHLQTLQPRLYREPTILFDS